MRYLVILFISALVYASPVDINLIGGKPVPAGEHKEIVDIQTGNAGCTATVVGPRVIVTAAHCAATREVSKFKIDGVQYSTVATRHPRYPNADVDVSLAISAVDIAVHPMTIDSEAVLEGDKIDLYGFGCVRPGGGGGNDGILRTGSTTVTRRSGQLNESGRLFKRYLAAGYDFVMKGNGVALCMGDSGGPALRDGKQVGVNSKGDIKTTSYDLDLTHPEVQSWMLAFAQNKRVEICGVNLECGPGE